MNRVIYKSSSTFRHLVVLLNLTNISQHVMYQDSWLKYDKQADRACQSSYYSHIGVF